MTAERAAVAGATAGDIVPGRLMRLVAGGLTARGLRVYLPEDEDDWGFSVGRLDGCCDLTVGDCGLVRWEWLPWSGKEPDPALAANIAAFLLTGKDGDHADGEGGGGLRGLSFKGVVGNELRSRGFTVGLMLCEDPDYLEVSSEISVTNSVANPQSSVRIDDSGWIAWECESPFELARISGSRERAAVLASPGELADSIAVTVWHAILLSSGDSMEGVTSDG